MFSELPSFVRECYEFWKQLELAGFHDRLVDVLLFTSLLIHSNKNDRSTLCSLTKQYHLLSKTNPPQSSPLPPSSHPISIQTLLKEYQRTIDSLILRNRATASILLAICLLLRTSDSRHIASTLEAVSSGGGNPSAADDIAHSIALPDTEFDPTTLQSLRAAPPPPPWPHRVIRTVLSHTHRTDPQATPARGAGEQDTDVARLRLRVTELEQALAECRDQKATIRALRARLAEHHAQIETMVEAAVRRRLEAEAQRQAEIENRIDTRLSAAVEVGHRADLQEARNQAARLELRIKSLEQELQAAISGRERAELRAGNLEADLARALEAVQEARALRDRDVQMLQEEVQALTAQAQRLTADMEMLVQERDALLQDRDALSQERDELVQKLQETKLQLQEPSMPPSTSPHPNIPREEHSVPDTNTISSPCPFVSPSHPCPIPQPTHNPPSLRSSQYCTDSDTVAASQQCTHAAMLEVALVHRTRLQQRIADLEAQLSFTQNTAPGAAGLISAPHDPLSPASVGARTLFMRHRQGSLTRRSARVALFFYLILLHVLVLASLYRARHCHHPHTARIDNP